MTKEIAQVRSDLSKEIEQTNLKIEQTRQEITKEVHQTQLEIAKINAHIESSKNEMLKWSITLWLTNLSAVLFVIWRLLG